MLDFGWSQMLLIAAVALVVLGPKELPKVLKSITEWAGKARTLAREFRSSVDEMIRETELNNLKKEFESGVRKAESEFQNTIESHSIPFDDLSPTPADTSVTPAMPEYYTSANWGDEGIKLRPLMDHQRRKKPVRKAERPVYKQRLLRPPGPGDRPPAVRRRVRA